MALARCPSSSFTRAEAVASILTRVARCCEFGWGKWVIAIPLILLCSTDFIANYGDMWSFASISCVRTPKAIEPAARKRQKKTVMN